MPDLEMPGNTAIACDKPIKMAIFELIGKDLIFIFFVFKRSNPVINNEIATTKIFYHSQVSVILHSF